MFFHKAVIKFAFYGRKFYRKKKDTNYLFIYLLNAVVIYD